MQHENSDSDEEDEIPEEVVREVEDFENKPKSNLDETETVNFGDAETVKETRINIHLLPIEKEECIRFLKEYEDIFAWSYNDMTDLSTSTVAHKLPTNPMCSSVKHKLRKFKPDMSLKIKEEVTKKIKAKIWIDKEDADKTTFITPWGVYFYKMMPFGLKNVGDTYIRAMTTIFHDMTHKQIEVYVDGVIIKSKRAADHRADLKKYFDRLRRYNLKLNPAKCAFGVPAGKLLGFIVSRRGIELDPSKVKAIQELPPPRSKKDVKAVKGQTLANHLAENPVGGEYEPLKTYFLDEEVSFVGEDIIEAYDGGRMFFEGAANFKGVGIGAVLVSETGQHYPVQGEWVTKNSKILPYLHHVQELRKRFTKIEFRHVPRIQNEFDNALVTLSSMIQHPNKNYIDPIPAKIHNQPTYCAHVEEETNRKLWFYDIKEYLSKGEYPEHANHTQKCTLWRLSNRFFHSGGNLYRRTPDLGLLRFVDAKDASKLLEDVHDGTYVPHMNGFVLDKKILRAGYFWMTMETDYIKFVRKCFQCQVHGNMIKVPPNELNVTS
ncbi:uncharacterized protein [Nicotiana sylvestris]|uniref:uncharacterized protein n=1 Tax=Nicotiana sylvestris TaxID=4096 RepID=UPI00388CDF12